MAGDSVDKGPVHDLEQAQRIHSFCEEFEASCRAGDSPRIEEYLLRASENDQSVLLRELLFLEVELKHSSGEAISAAAYRSRFPEAASAIEVAFAEGETAPHPSNRAAQS